MCSTSTARVGTSSKMSCLSISIVFCRIRRGTYQATEASGMKPIMRIGSSEAHDSNSGVTIAKTNQNRVREQDAPGDDECRVQQANDPTCKICIDRKCNQHNPGQRENQYYFPCHGFALVVSGVEHQAEDPVR